MNKKGGMGMGFALLLLVAVLILGLIGNEKTKEMDIECQAGWKNSLCWKWENSTATLEEKAKEKASDITGYLIKKIVPVAKEELKEAIFE